MSKVEGDWDETTLTWNNAPKTGEFISESIAQPNDWSMFEITNILKQTVSKNIRNLSLVFSDTANTRTIFATRFSEKKPTLSVVYKGDEKIDIIHDDKGEYRLNTNAYDFRTQTVSYPTRVLETIEGFDISSQASPMGRYGGYNDICYVAEGKYYTKQINERWWLIDPDGHPIYPLGVCLVTPGESSNQNRRMLEVFGTTGNWAQQTRSLLKDELFFNMSGGFSRNEWLGGNTVENSMALTEWISFLRWYGYTIGVATGSANESNVFTQNNTMPVFDPDFVTYADNIARSNAERCNNNEYFIGWMSDNELPATDAMLINYLTLNTDNPINAYSYAAAWTWLCDYTGKDNPQISDVTDAMKEDFIEFVYDRYYSVCATAIKKWSPDKLYLGSRHVVSNYLRKSTMAAAGRWCDIVSINVYCEWTPKSLLMADWYEWSKKPYMVTEFYAMAADSGLGNSGGAGWKVATQNDRGRFYENFVLKLLQDKNCIGFTWFTYQDNDPHNTVASSDQADSNKGIVDNDFNLWSPLGRAMKKINRQIYQLIDFFDKRV